MKKFGNLGGALKFFRFSTFFSFFTIFLYVCMYVCKFIDRQIMHFKDFHPFSCTLVKLSVSL